MVRGPHYEQQEFNRRVTVVLRLYVLQSGLQFIVITLLALRVFGVL